MTGLSVSVVPHPYPGRRGVKRGETTEISLVQSSGAAHVSPFHPLWVREELDGTNSRLVRAGPDATSYKDASRRAERRALETTPPAIEKDPRWIVYRVGARICGRSRCDEPMYVWYGVFHGVTSG